MILIVDSGSTKSDWVAVDQNGNKLLEKIRTQGLNPAIISEKKLKERIKESEDLVTHRAEVTHVFFYGAGAGTNKAKAVLKDVLQNVFKNAEITVEEDTMAAVFSTINHENEAAIVCIMGTGSNCSYYDGNKLHQRVISLGYSLMDDASGNYYGKQLIRDYYFNHMPENIRVAFETKYNLDADYIKSNLYKQPSPNAYLASFAEFMFLNKDSDYILNLIKDGIRVFTKNYIMQYADRVKTDPVHFAGSIAYFSQDQIREVAQEMGFIMGNVVRRPIDALAAFHTSKL
ncbi:MAG: BadF/BadG/BcrA/BcrD ATPase family protein [Flavobacteriaceae bacterium]